MKLFQWVHRKLRQNSIDPFKDFTLGNPCVCLTVQPTLDNQYSQRKPSFSSINQPGFLKPYHQGSQTYHSGFNDIREEDKSQEETLAVVSELFEGFLTIGTLGAETVTNEPATPTFAMPLENSTMTDAEVTENELKLISYELEKFLEAEKESFYESSGRNSRVNDVTLGGKQTDGPEAEDFGNTTVCPLQGYLLGSSFELQEKIEVTKERASLAELFHGTETTNEDCIETGVREKQVKQAHKPAMHIMKKMLKMVHSSSKSRNTTGNDADSASTNTKFRVPITRSSVPHLTTYPMVVRLVPITRSSVPHLTTYPMVVRLVPITRSSVPHLTTYPMVLRMFHRKVYPENNINAKKFTKSHKGKIKNLPHDCFNENDNGDTTNPDPGRRFHSDSKSRKWFQHCKTNGNPPQHDLSCSGSTGNNEHWIKTDAEYLVLEL